MQFHRHRFFTWISLPIVFVMISLLLSCTEEGIEETSDEILSGQWFREHTNRVHVNPDLTEERGETHYIMTFSEDSTFRYEIIILGIYEGMNPDDTSAWSIDDGIYSLKHKELTISLHTFSWWDSFYGATSEPQLREVTFDNKYLEPTYRIYEDSLFFNYHNLTRDGQEFRSEKFVKLFR